MTRFLRTKEFLKKFPQEIAPFCLEHKLYSEGFANISERTLQHYVTHGFYPRPIKDGKKAGYEDIPENYKRLLVVRYLISQHSFGEATIREIQKHIKTKARLDFFASLMRSKEFCEDVIKKGSIAKSAKKHDHKLILSNSQLGWLIDSLTELLIDDERVVKIEINKILGSKYDGLKSKRATSFKHKVEKLSALNQQLKTYLNTASNALRRLQ